MALQLSVGGALRLILKSPQHFRTWKLCKLNVIYNAFSSGALQCFEGIIPSSPRWRIWVIHEMRETLGNLARRLFACKFTHSGTISIHRRILLDRCNPYEYWRRMYVLALPSIMWLFAIQASFATIHIPTGVASFNLNHLESRSWNWKSINFFNHSCMDQVIPHLRSFWEGTVNESSEHFIWFMKVVNVLLFPHSSHASSCRKWFWFETEHAEQTFNGLEWTEFNLKLQAKRCLR